ncbi:uncharacterized protein LOC122501480 [Leptopilina heterotoma]|uniref:uncharacterized protein LOC122501480 n=1 Tax=Leptopilina heterotoma TaxID=63436 RepID=UPI001CA9533A|nr:uncharacterized protein LOC122501480 [Leptopilina heterotoma]
MLRLAIICILNLLVNGNIYMGEEMRLMDLNASLFNAENYMNNQIINENSAIFFGNPRAGRSTLINYLMGNRLKGVRLSHYSPIELIKAENTSIGPEIGIGSLSTTKIPSKWTSQKLPNLTLWDIPGFKDNRGPVQDITNSFYFYQLVKKVKSLKIVLVVDIHDIEQDNINDFSSLLNSIENLFGNNFKNYFESTSVVFTKVRQLASNGELIDKEYVDYHLANYLLLDSGLRESEVMKNFTTFILYNNDRIALFMRNSKLGIVNNDLGVDIFSTLNNSKFIESSFLQGVRPSISASSMLQLFKSEELIELDLMVLQLERMLKSLINMEMKNLDTAVDTIKINCTKYKLLEMQQMLLKTFSNDNNLPQMAQILSSMADDTFDKQKFHKNIRLLQSVENMLNITISKPLKFTIDSVIFSASLKLKTAISFADVKLGDITEKEHLETLKKHEDVNKTLQMTNDDINMLKESDLSWWDTVVEKIVSAFNNLKNAILSFFNN